MGKIIDANAISMINGAAIKVFRVIHMNLKTVINDYENLYCTKIWAKEWRKSKAKREEYRLLCWVRLLGAESIIIDAIWRATEAKAWILIRNDWLMFIHFKLHSLRFIKNDKAIRHRNTLAQVGSHPFCFSVYLSLALAFLGTKPLLLVNVDSLTHKFLFLHQSLDNWRDCC